MLPDHYIRVGDYVVGPGANLYGARLQDADLRLLDLRKADFRTASLGGANFMGSDLRGALLGGAHLSGANFLFAKVDLPDEYVLRDGVAVRVKPTKPPYEHREKAKWYTVARITRDGKPHPAYHRVNFSPRHAPLQQLLAYLQVSFKPGKNQGAYAAVVWEGKLSEEAALNDPDEVPLCYVLEDGTISEAWPA